jgi:hypothetical protein
VEVRIDLRMQRIDDGGKVVSEIRAAEAAGEVDVLAPVDVPDARTFGSRDDERWGRDAARDVAFAGFLDAFGGVSLLQRHGVPTVYGAFSARKLVGRSASGGDDRCGELGPEGLFSANRRQATLQLTGDCFRIRSPLGELIGER